MAQSSKVRATIEKNKIRSADEARAKGRKGGIASGKKRRLMKNTRDCFEAIKNSPLPTNINKQVNTFFGTSDVEYTFAMLNLFNLLKAGCEGNANAMKQIMEVDGSMEKEKPNEAPVQNVYIVSSTDVARQFAQAERYGMPTPAPLDDDEDDEDDEDDF